ncbi:MAG: TPM domain-containing protein [Oscillospiraceae bacterium]|nr:TPM domain-containing protein [Oscillospiraceae bacterium]
MKLLKIPLVFVIFTTVLVMTVVATSEIAETVETTENLEPVNLFDQDSYFSDSRFEASNSRLLEAENQVGFRVTVLMADYAGAITERLARQFTENFYHQNIGVGVDGIMLFINTTFRDSINIRYDYIYISGNAQDYFNSRRFESLFDTIWNNLLNEDYSSAISGFSRQVTAYVESGKPFSTNALIGVIIIIVVNAIIIFGIIFGVKNSYKLKPAECASNYLDQYSIKYRQQSDTFIRSFITKVRISSNSNSGGGFSGGGFSGGGRGR